MAIYDYLNKEITNSNDVDLYDLTKINWRRFTTNNPIRKYTVLSEDLDKIYMISYKVYSDTQYTDLILFVNKIVDPFSLYAGQSLQIPDLQDILNFINSELSL